MDPNDNADGEATVAPPGFRDGFGFTVPRTPERLAPDLKNYSFGADDHAGRIQAPSAGMGSTLLGYCKRQQWDVVEDIVRSFERLVQAAMENATIIRNALNFQDNEDGGTFSLMYLAERNKIGLMERCLVLGADINRRTENGQTAMHSAALSGSQEMIEALLQHGADTCNPGGELQQLPLHLACLRPFGALPIVKLLLENTESMARLIEDAEGFIPLWRAAEVSNLPVIRLLLEEQTQQQISKQNPVQDNESVLHYCIRSYHSGIFEELLEYDSGNAVDLQNDEKQTLLHLAVLTENVPVVERLREKGANPNLTDRFDRTPIQLAIEKGHQKITEAFISAYPESIRLRTKDGSTLCHLAALSGHPETMLVLLNRGVYLHMPNKFGAVALHAAARTGHAGVVKALLTRGAKVDAKTKDNRTALHLAVEYGKFHSVETLLGDGASVHIKGGKAGETPLHIAARVPNSDYIADLLIKSGSLLDSKMVNGETALHAGARAGALKMVQLLLKEGADARVSSENGETALHLAVRSGNYALAGEILRHLEAKYSRNEAVTIVNMQNEEGETSVHYAAETNIQPISGEVSETLPPQDIHDMMKLLLDYGGEPHIQTKLTYETPMHYAARSGNNAVLEAMFAHFPPAKMQFAMQRRTKIGWPPLLIACDQGLDETVKLFLENHARIDVFDEGGRSALHIASENGFVEVVDLLLQHKAFVNSKTRTGFSPLHLAAMKGHTALAALLIQKFGAAIDILSMSKQTPLHLAAKYKQIETFQLLLRSGADPMIRDQQGQTPLFLATALDSADVVLQLIAAMGEQNPMSVTDARGLNVAHVAARSGAVEVMDILLSRYQDEVTQTQVKSTGMTAVHYAAAEGHGEILLKLVNAGAAFKDEDKEGMTIVHLAAKNGHLPVLNVLHDLVSWSLTSIKTGLVPIHLAAFWGEADSVREFLTKVPANIRSARPTVNTAIVKQIEAEAGLTPLHLGCKGGHENVVRLLLNYPGVELDAVGETTGFTPLHMAALSGHIPIAALLIAKSESCLTLVDKRGRTAMLLAAGNGKKELVLFFVSQGVDMDATDTNGWTALHHAASHGHLDVVKALVEHGANPQVLTVDGKTPMNFAAHDGHIEILNYFFTKHLDFEKLTSDPSFAVDLMKCAKPLEQAPLESFIIGATSPVEVALKLAFFYRSLAINDRERALDLTYAAMYCETLANRILTLACTRHAPEVLFRAIDEKGDTLLDMILDGQHKTVASLNDVQKYLMIVWQSGLNLTDTQTTLVLFLFLLFPPSWIAFNLPFRHRFRGVPLLKLLSNLAGNIFFILLLVFVFLNPHERLYERKSMSPNPQECVLLVWLAGLVLHEATSKEKRTGFARMQLIVIVMCAIGFVIQAAAIPFQPETQVVMLYVRCQFFATASLFAHIQLLSYMAFHRLFGPLSVMIGEIFRDMTTFLVILGCFVVGSTFAFSALYEEVYRPEDIVAKGHNRMLLIGVHGAAALPVAVSHQTFIPPSHHGDITPPAKGHKSLVIPSPSHDEGMISQPASSVERHPKTSERPKTVEHSKTTNHPENDHPVKTADSAHPSMASPLKAFQHPSPKTVDHAGKEHPVHPTVTVNHHGETRHKREDHGQHGGPSPTNGEHHTAVNAHGTSPEAGTGGLHDGAGEGGGHSAGGAEHGGGHSAGGEAGHHEEGGEHEHFVAPGPGPLLDRRADPIISLQYMTFGIWGFIDPMPDPREQNFRPLHPLPAQDQLPGIGKVWLRFLIGIYLFLVMIVLMKLLVAMLVDTYERIKRSSDFEWRYGRAKLIYGLEITEGTPPPLNLVTWATNAAMKLVHKLRGRTSHSASQQSLVKVGANYVRLNKSRPSVASALSASDGMKLIHSVVLWREIVHMYKSQNKTDLKQAEDMNEVGI